MKQTSIGWTQLRNLIGQLALILLFYAVGSHAASAAPKRVLLLYSFGLNALHGGEHSKQLRTELVKKFQNEVDFFEATLETARYPGDVADRPFADYLFALFSKCPPIFFTPSTPQPASRLQRHLGFSPTVISLAAPRYDRRELQRWGIQETNLCRAGISSFLLLARSAA